MFLLFLSKSKYMYFFLLKCYAQTGLSLIFEDPRVRCERRSLVPDAFSQLWPLSYQASPSGLLGIPWEIATHTSRFFFTAALWPSLGPERIYTCGIISPQEDRWIKGLHGFRQLSKKFQGSRSPEQERGCGLWAVGRHIPLEAWNPALLERDTTREGLEQSPLKCRVPGRGAPVAVVQEWCYVSGIYTMPEYILHKWLPWSGCPITYSAQSTVTASF